MRTSARIAASLLALAACGVSCQHRQEPGFAGTWVLTVEGKPLWVLTLEPEDGRYAGTLERPRHMTSDGRTFSGIGRETTKERVTSDVPRVSAADDKSDDKQEYELSLTSGGRGAPEND